MPEVKVSAEWEDRVSTGFKQLASNVREGAASAATSTQQLGQRSEATAEQVRRNAQALQAATVAINTYKTQFDPAKNVTSEVTQRIAKMTEELGLSSREAKRFAAIITETTNAGASFDESLEHANEELARMRGQAVAASQGLGQANAGFAQGTELIQRFLGPLTLAAVTYKLYNDVIKEGVRNAVEAETAQLRLENILEVTGRGSRSTAAGIQAWATSLANLSGVSDESISNMVAQAVAMGQNEAQARKLAEAAVILHNRLGRDLEGSFQELLQTLDGTAGRYIKNIQGMNQLTEAELRSGQAADVIAKALGTSEAQGVAGAWARLQNAISEDRENLGKALTGAGDGASRLENLLNRLADAVNALNNVRLPDWMKQLIDKSEQGFLGSIPGGRLFDLLTKTQNPQSPIKAEDLAKLPTGEPATVELPPGFVDLQAQMRKVLADTDQHEHDFGALFEEYRKAFDPATAAEMAHDAVISGRRLSDVTKALAGDLEARREAEQRATKAVDDLIASGMDAAEATAEASKLLLGQGSTSAELAKVQKEAAIAIDRLINESEQQWRSMLKGDRGLEIQAAAGAARIDREIDLRIARREPAFPGEQTPEEVGRQVRAGIRRNLNDTPAESARLRDVDQRLNEINKKWLEQLSVANDRIELGKSLAKTFFGEMTDGIADLILGAKDLGEIVSALLHDIERQFVQGVIKGALSAIPVIGPFLSSSSAPSNPSANVDIGPRPSTVRQTPQPAPAPPAPAPPPAPVPSSAIAALVSSIRDTVRALTPTASPAPTPAPIPSVPSSVLAAVAGSIRDVIRTSIPAAAPAPAPTPIAAIRAALPQIQTAPVAPIPGALPIQRPAPSPAQPPSERNFSFAQPPLPTTNTQHLNRIHEELQGLRRDLRSSTDAIPTPQLVQAVARAILPEIRRADARGL